MENYVQPSDLLERSLTSPYKEKYIHLYEQKLCYTLEERTMMVTEKYTDKFTRARFEPTNSRLMCRRSTN